MKIMKDIIWISCIKICHNYRFTWMSYLRNKHFTYKSRSSKQFWKWFVKQFSEVSCYFRRSNFWHGSLFFLFFLIFSKGNHFPWIFVESKFSRIRTNIGIDNDDDSFAMECLLFVILCKWVILKYRIALSSFLESFPMAV